MYPWSRGREVAASYALLPNLRKLFFAITEGTRIFVICFLHNTGRKFLYQTPGRRPPRITGRVVCTGQRVGWSPQGRRPVQISRCNRWFCRSMSAEDSEFRRFELNVARGCSGRYWPIIWAGFFLFFFLKVATFFL